MTIESTGFVVTPGSKEIQYTGPLNFNHIVEGATIDFEGVPRELALESGTKNTTGTETGTATLTLVHEYPLSYPPVNASVWATINEAGGFTIATDAFQRRADYVAKTFRAFDAYVGADDEALEMPMLGGGTSIRKSLPAIERKQNELLGDALTHSVAMDHVFITTGMIATPNLQDDFQWGNAGILRANTAMYYINKKVVEVSQTDIPVPVAPTASSRLDLIFVSEDGAYVLESGLEQSTTPADVGYSSTSEPLEYEKSGIRYMLLLGFTRYNTLEYNAITNPLGGTSRADGYQHDVLHSGQCHDFRKSANGMSHTPNSILQRAVANRLRGWEGLPELHIGSGATVTVGGSASMLTSSGGVLTFPTTASTNPRGVNTIELSETSALTKYILIAGDNGQAMRIPTPNSTASNILWPFSDNSAYIVNIGNNSEVVTEFNSKFPTGTALKILAETESNVKFAVHSITDLIGDPTNIKTMLDGYGLTKLLGARWIPEIPNNTSQLYKLTRKAGVSSVSRQYTSDNGTTWISTPATINAIENNYADTWSSSFIHLMSYETPAYPLRPTALSPVLKSELSELLSTNAFDEEYGAILCANTTGFIPTNSSNPRIQQGGSLSGYLIDDKSSNGELIAGVSAYSPSHAPITLSGTTDGIKTFCYLTYEDSGTVFGVRGQFVIKQLKYDAAWGDDGKFNIVDDVSTIPDDNGNTVLIGTYQTDILGFISKTEVTQ